MTAKLIDPKRRSNFQVLVLPNLYGDILTDEAAEFQGGVGTAGSANIGTQYAMFEAIHGSAPRMVREGRAQYADPSSMIRASAMLLSHIGFPDLGRKLDMAMDLCGQYEKRITMTGRSTGATVARVRRLRPGDGPRRGSRCALAGRRRAGVGAGALAAARAGPQSPAAARSPGAIAVLSQGSATSVRPKCPKAAVRR